MVHCLFRSLCLKVFFNEHAPMKIHWNDHLNHLKWFFNCFSLLLQSDSLSLSLFYYTILNRILSLPKMDLMNVRDRDGVYNIQHFNIFQYDRMMYSFIHSYIYIGLVNLMMHSAICNNNKKMDNDDDERE